MTTDERLALFQRRIHAATLETGITIEAAIKHRQLNRSVGQTEAELIFVTVKDWQESGRAPIEFPEDEDNENPLPVSANGAVPAQSE